MMAMVEMMQTTTVWARMIPVAYSILLTLKVEVSLQLGILINHCTALHCSQISITDLESNDQLQASLKIERDKCKILFE